MTDTNDAASDWPEFRRVTMGDIWGALGDGVRDFRRAPSFGLFFSLFYVLGGIVIYLQISVIAESWWVIPIAMGFPLLGPFVAVGLYEVSRRMERGEALDWAGVLGVVLRQRSRQIPSIAALVIIVFLFWVYAAHLVFALFFGLKSLTNIMSSYEILWTTDGIIMLAVGTAVGGALSLLLYSITVAGLPLLLDRELDFVTAMIASVVLVRDNPAPMLFWGALVAVLLFIGMAPFFLGLFIVLPVLGHATWRLYSRVKV